MNPFALALLAGIYGLGVCNVAAALRAYAATQGQPRRFTTDIDWIMPAVCGLALSGFVLYFALQV